MTITVKGRAPLAGEPAVFCRPVVTAPAVVRRDGTVLADAWLPDLVRLGELEAHLGDGVIEAAVDAAVAAGRLKQRQRRRIMSYPLVIRLVIAMTLMPDASYCEALARLAGLLADIPFLLEWHVPTGKVVTDWRLPVPPALLEDLFWQAAGPLIGDDEPSAVLLAGMMVLAADGMLVNVADTPANRAFFGSTGTADDSSPFPQLRVVAVTARAGRATAGAILGQAGTGEQTLLKRLVKRRPGLFAGRVICFDRNFPGYDLIMAILAAGGHVIARVKEGISLGFEDGPGRGWLPDGSRMTWLNAPSGKKADRLPVRAAEHNVTMPGAGGEDQASETCTVITTLLDHQAAPAGQVRDAYLTRWSASETTFGEDKSTIAGAGNRTSGPVLRSGSPRLVIQEAWAWLTATQLVRASEAAALPHRGRSRPRTAPQVPDPGHRRRGILHRRPAPHHPVDDIRAGHSYLIAGSDRSSGRLRRPRMPAHPQSPRPATALRAGAESTAEIPARQRHQDNHHRETQGHRVRTRLLLTPAPGPATGRRNPAPASRDPRPVEPRAVPAATRGLKPCPRITRKQTSRHARNMRTTTPQED
jgi:hypothetical protein